MSLRTHGRARPWRGGLALVVACACLPLLTLSATAGAGNRPYCPATAGSTITLGSIRGCTNGYSTLLLSVGYHNPNVVWHCASAEEEFAPDGSSPNVLPEVCNYGDLVTGEVISNGPVGGVRGYARGVNRSAFSASGFYGIKFF